MKNTLLLSLLLALVGSLPSGCKTQTAAPPPVELDPRAAEIRESFQLMDPGAQRSLACASLRHRTLSDGRLEATANVRNLENRRLQVQVNCEFKDGDGFVVDATPWQTLILTENSEETVSFTSMNQEAKKFTIRVREAR